MAPYLEDKDRDKDKDGRGCESTAPASRCNAYKQCVQIRGFVDGFHDDMSADGGLQWGVETAAKLLTLERSKIHPI